MDKYVLSNIVGKIDQSGVFLGTSKTSGKHTAIKLFSEVSEAQKESLLHDAKILQNLSHPNLVRILESGIDEGNNVFYVMEYLEGIPLHHFVPQEGLSFEDSWAMIEKLANALLAIHEAGVLHLDLKPGNILMVSGEPKIIDFGILPPKEPGSFRGTPGYIAPEVILGQAPTIKSDIYSFGALLAFIWTGHKLYNTLAHQLKNLSEHLANPDLEKIISRATRQDPARRYANIGEMLKALSLYHHEQDYRSAEPNEDPTHSKWGHWVIAAVISTLVCIAVGIYYSLLHSI
ncbi:MAG: serine/threonine-protein kinase [Myxococcaceae bacterium]